MSDVQKTPIQHIYEGLAAKNPDLKEYGFDAFANDMKDENNLKSLYSGLAEKNPTLKETGFDSFKSDVWGEQPDTQQEQPLTYMQKELRERFPENYTDEQKPEVQPQNNAPKESGSVASELNQQLKQGTNETIAAAYGIPGYAYDFVGAGLRALGLDVPTYKESGLTNDVTIAGVDINPLSILDQAKENLLTFSKQNAEKVRELNPDIDKGVVEPIQNGEYKKAIRNLFSSMTQSAPASAAMMLSGGLSTPMQVGAGAALFGSQNLNQADQEGDYGNVSRDAVVAISSVTGALESIFETTFGSGAAGKAISNIIKKEGKKQATETIKKGFTDNVIKLITENPWMAPFGEAYEEMGTQLAQNAVNKYSGYKPDINLMDGVYDAGLLGFGMGSVHGGLIEGTKRIVNGVENTTPTDNTGSQQPTGPVSSDSAPQFTISPRQQAEFDLRSTASQFANNETGLLQTIQEVTPDGQENRIWFIKAGQTTDPDGSILVEDEAGNSKFLTKEQIAGEPNNMTIDDFVNMKLSEYDQTQQSQELLKQNQIQIDGKQYILTGDQTNKGLVALTDDGSETVVPFNVVDKIKGSGTSNANIIQRAYGKTNVTGIKNDDGSITLTDNYDLDKANSLKEEIEKSTGGKATVQAELIPNEDSTLPDSYQLSIIPVQSNIDTSTENTQEINQNDTTPPSQDNNVSAEQQIQPEQPKYTLNGNEIDKTTAKARVRAAILKGSADKLAGLEISNDPELSGMIEKAFPKPKAKFTLGKKTISPEDAMDWIVAADNFNELNELKSENIDSEPAVAEAFRAKVKYFTTTQREVENSGNIENTNRENISENQNQIPEQQNVENIQTKESSQNNQLSNEESEKSLPLNSKQLKNNVGRQVIYRGEKGVLNVDEENNYIVETSDRIYELTKDGESTFYQNNLRWADKKINEPHNQEKSDIIQAEIDSEKDNELINDELSKEGVSDFEIFTIDNILDNFMVESVSNILENGITQNTTTDDIIEAIIWAENTIDSIIKAFPNSEYAFAHIESIDNLIQYLEYENTKLTTKQGSNKLKSQSNEAPKRKQTENQKNVASNEKPAMQAPESISESGTNQTENTTQEEQGQGVNEGLEKDVTSVNNIKLEVGKENIDNAQNGDRFKDDFGSTWEVVKSKKGDEHSYLYLIDSDGNYSTAHPLNSRAALFVASEFRGRKVSSKELETNVTDPVAEQKETREELEIRLLEERKQRILTEGTGFDKEFGLIPPSEIKSSEEILLNIDKILSTLKANEGNKKYDIFEGYAYKENYTKNAGEQIRGYFHALDVLPNEIRKDFASKINANTQQKLMDWASKKYKDIIPDVSNEFDQVRDVAGQDSGQRPAVKESWQMTRDEYTKSVGANGYWAETSAISDHNAAVRNALFEGKQVPEEVLNDYPELKPVVQENLNTEKPKSLNQVLEEGKKEVQEKKQAEIEKQSTQLPKEPKKPLMDVLKEGKEVIEGKKLTPELTLYNVPESFNEKSFIEFNRALAKGEVNVDQFKKAFEVLLSSKDAIISELNGMTKAELLKGMSGMGQYRYKNEKKDATVKAIWSDHLMDFAFGSISYTFDGTPMEQIVAKKVANTTQKNIDDYVAETQKRKQEYINRVQEFKKALTNPETLPEFRIFIDKNGLDKLSPEQKAAYDNLVTDKTIEKRNTVIENKSVVSKVDLAGVELDITETKHTKTGADLFVVKLSERVSKEDYQDLNSKAKQLGGYYSSFRGQGAVPGFQFKSREQAQKFVDLKKQDASNLDLIEEKQDTKLADRVSKLRENAQKIIDRVDSELSKGRLTNTAKRASQAASTEARLGKEKQIAQTMMNIANAIENGDVKLLDGVKAKTHIELLDGLINQAKYKEISADSPTYTERMAREGEPATVKTVEFAQDSFYPNIYADHIKSLIDKVGDRSGVKLIASRWSKKLLSTKSQDYYKVKSQSEVDELTDMVNALRGNEKSYNRVAEEIADYNRLKSMGIENDSMLRAALREYVQYRGKSQEVDKVKKLERALVGRKNIGIDFFPTPKETAQLMVDEAGITEGMDVLEPSAGNGNIADAIKETGVQPDVIELSSALSEVLEAKGYDVVASDFMDFDGKKYDRIVMNPPFSNGMDGDHVQHAYELLKPGGRIVAIVGEGTFIRNDKKAVAFREWLDEVGGTEEKLNQGTFQDRTLLNTTGANARLVIIDKSQSDANFRIIGETGVANLDGEFKHTDHQNLIDKLESGAIETDEVILDDNEGLALQLAGKISDKDLFEIRNSGRDLGGFEIFGKVYINSIISPMEVVKTWIHEKTHRQLKRIFPQKARREQFLNKVFDHVGEMEINATLPKIYHGDSKEQRAEEYIAFKVQEYGMTGNVNADPEIKNIIFELLNRFTTLKNIQDATHGINLAQQRSGKRNTYDGLRERSGLQENGRTGGNGEPNFNRGLRQDESREGAETSRIKELSKQANNNPSVFSEYLSEAKKVVQAKKSDVSLGEKPMGINKKEPTSASFDNVGDGSTPPKESGDNATESKNVSSDTIESKSQLLTDSEDKQNSEPAKKIYSGEKALDIESIGGFEFINKRSYWFQNRLDEDILVRNGFKDIVDVLPNVTEKDYFISTKGKFNVVSKSEWDNLSSKIHLSDSGSLYKIKDGILYRRSNHWGKVATCEWSINSNYYFRHPYYYYKNNEGKEVWLGKDEPTIVGKIAIEDLKRIPSSLIRYDRQQPANTILINGTPRPTLNSNGKPIANSEEGIINFWKWFGDSKVVDEQGRPLVVYHGTGSDFNEFNSKVFPTAGYFSKTPDIANSTAHGQKEYYGKDSSVMPVYLSIDKPLDLLSINGIDRYSVDDIIKLLPFKLDEILISKLRIEYKQPNPLWSYMGSANLINKIKSEGYNGVKYKEGEVDEDLNKYLDVPINNTEAFIAFNSSQIKSATGNNGSFDPDNNDIRYRRGEVPLNDHIEEAARQNQEAKKTRRNLSEVAEGVREFIQDHDLPIRRLEEKVKQLGGKIADNMKPYRDMSLSYGRMETLYKNFTKEKFEPIIKTISKIVKSGTPAGEVLPYVICKHALERNPYMRAIELKEWQDNAEIELKKWTDANIDIPQATKDRKVKEFTDALESKRQELSKKDYSGVRGFDPSNNFETPDELAQEIVDEFERKTPVGLVDELWSNVKNATSEIVDIWGKGQTMSEEQVQQTKDRFKYFVPLRGWRHGVAKQLVYKKGEGFSGSLQRIKGRTSIAENPLAYIEQIAFKALGEQVDNEVKTSLLNLVVGNYGDDFQQLYRLKKAYYIKDGIDENGEQMWKLTTERPSEELFKSGDAVTKIYNQYQKLRTPSRAHEHEVYVKRPNGDLVVVMVGDMLPVAQAMNHKNTMYRSVFGNEIHDADDLNRIATFDLGFGIIPKFTMGGLNNFLKGMYTAYNIVFPITNFMRDAQEASITQFIKGDNGHLVVKNYKNAFPAIIRSLRGKESGGKYDEMLKEFRETGGNTGYTHLKTPEQLEKEINSELEMLNRTGTFRGYTIDNARKALSAIEAWNQIFEDATRFSVYITSREAGKSAKEAANDSKEASVNFNRKGKSSKAFDSVWAFWNVAIQSMQKNFKLAKDHKGKFGMVAGAWLALGFLEAMMNDDMGGDDDNDYYNISDYVRENYLIIPILFGDKKDKYLRIPLPQFWRGFKSAGSIAYDVMNGKMDGLSATAKGLGNFLGGLLPIDIGGFYQNGEFSMAPVIPTIIRPAYEVKSNRDYMGYTIAKEPFTKEQERLLADSGLGKDNVSPAIKFFTDYLFRAGSGDNETRFYTQNGDIKKVPGIFDYNPSYIEHLITGYTGGTGKFVTDVLTTAIDGLDSEKEIDFRNAPFINQFIKKIPEAKWKVIGEYYDIKSEGNESAFGQLERSYFSQEDKTKYKEVAGSNYLNEYNAVVNYYDKRLTTMMQYMDYKTAEGSEEVINTMKDAIEAIKQVKQKYNKK